ACRDATTETFAYSPRFSHDSARVPLRARSTLTRRDDSAGSVLNFRNAQWSRYAVGRMCRIWRPSVVGERIDPVCTGAAAALPTMKRTNQRAGHRTRAQTPRRRAEKQRDGRARTRDGETRMTLLAELEEFAREHRPHGGMSGDATEPASNGYRLTVACACGVVFERWITSDDAQVDFVGIASLN